MALYKSIDHRTGITSVYDVGRPWFRKPANGKPSSGPGAMNAAIGIWEEAIMMPEIVFSDVDGTLLDSNHKILPGTVHSIYELQKKNIPFVIISARSPSGIRPILRENNFSCPMICYSGALILDRDGKILFSEGFSREAAGKMIKFIEDRRFDCTWNIYSHDTWIVKDRSDRRVKREEEIVHATAIEGDVSVLPQDAKIGKLLFMCNPERILEIEQEMKAAFPAMSIARSSDILLEIMQGGITKSTGVKKLCDLWGIPLESTLAFGDHYNDVEMLETVAQPVLMGNAPEELKHRFAYVTAGNDDEGIYKALMKLGIVS